MWYRNGAGRWINWNTNQRKKVLPPDRGLRTYLFEKDPWNFYRFDTLPLKITEKMKAHPLLLDIVQNCVRPIGISKNKNQDPWKFHMIFSWTSLEIWLKNPHFLIPWEIPCPCLDFSRLIAQFELINHYLLRKNRIDIT